MAKFLVISEYQDPHPDPQICLWFGYNLESDVPVGGIVFHKHIF